MSIGGLRLCLVLVLALSSAEAAAAQAVSPELSSSLQALALRAVRMPKRDVVCVGVSQHVGLIDPRTTVDPDSTLLSRLDWISDVRVSSACEFTMDARQSVFSRADHRPAVHLSVTVPHVTDHAHADVDVQVFWGTLYGEVLRCQLARPDKTWQVDVCRRIAQI